MTIKVSVRSGRFSLGSTEESTSVHIRWGEGDKFVNLHLNLDYYAQLVGQSWEDVIQQAISIWEGDTWISTQRSKVDELKAWLAEDGNEDDQGEVIDRTYEIQIAHRDAEWPGLKRRIMLDAKRFGSAAHAELTAELVADANSRGVIVPNHVGRETITLDIQTGEWLHASRALYMEDGVRLAESLLPGTDLSHLIPNLDK